MGIKYRPEIDGLRAIAVLAVVLYHAGIGGAGFVGVDVFFVISGYLITALLLKERAATGRIDLLAFYARRVRRIFPAAATVVLACLWAGGTFLAPEQQVHLDRSAGAALAFGANVFFQLTSGGYFDARASEMPLLHLWSLSVEEQFYLLWPALLILLPARRLRPALLGLAVLSLVAAEAWIARGSDAAFYAMPSRFWELAAGGLIATLPHRALPSGAAWGGLALTLAACIVPLGHFPGVGALPAVLGAALLIAAVHGGATNPLLRSKPMVGVGLISYSLYLWHWPLLAFYRASSIGEGSLQVRLALCGIAVLLAIASYRYIEQPFRRMRFKSGRTVVTGAVLSSALALSACVVGQHVQVQQAAHADNPAAVAAEHDMPSMACHISGADRMVVKCPPHSRVLLWGDSMAWAWLPAFPGASDVTMDACGPFVGYLPPDPHPGHYQCRDHNASAVALPADTVIIAARWHSYPDVAALAPSLDALRSVRRVVILGPTPEMRDEVPRCIRQHAEARCAITRAEFDAQAKPILATLRALAAKHPNVEVVDVTDRFCTATECPPVRDGVALYWDTHHVSSRAARTLHL